MEKFQGPAGRHQLQITDHEKRTRIQAWLGEQSPKVKANELNRRLHSSVGAMTAPADLSYRRKGGENENEFLWHHLQSPNSEMKLDSSLLMSESEFVTEDFLFTEAANVQQPMEKIVSDEIVHHFPMLPKHQEFSELGLHPTESDNTLSMSKYEEYEMRPIKPLDVDLQLEMYGAQTHVSPHFSAKWRPQPLKKHSGATSKHAVTGLRKSNLPKEVGHSAKHLAKKQCYVGRDSNDIIADQHAAQKGNQDLSAQRKRQQLISSNISNKDRATSKRKKVSRIEKNSAARLNTKVYSSGSNIAERSCDAGPYMVHGSQAEKTSSKQHLQSTFTISTDLKHVMAATRIQAAWRGYLARWKNPKVHEIRQELRYRRSEQYIRLLCHEMQIMKEKFEGEKQMRDLQTKAIRFMWDQMRVLQKKVNGTKHEQEPGGQPSSPRRSLSEAPCAVKSSCVDTTAQNTSPHMSTANSTTGKPQHVLQKVDTQAATFNQETTSSIKTDAHNAIDKRLNDTDEAEALKSTVEQLQCQVVQLQQALLSFSTKLHAPENDDENCEVNLETNDDSGAQDPIILLDLSDEMEKETEDEMSETKPEKEAEDEMSETEPDPTDLLSEHGPDDEVVSARDAVPKITLQDVMATLNSPLTEKELWSLCEQCSLAIKSRTTPLEYLSTDSVCVRKDGRVVFENMPSGVLIDSSFVAPEVEAEQPATEKSSLFGLSVTLWSAADYRMNDDEAPSLSDKFESMLVAMSHDEPSNRASLDQVLQMCEQFHRDAQCNSLQVCSSLFAEANSAQKKEQQQIHRALQSMVWKEECSTTQTCFRANVVPNINNFSFTLKSAKARVLPPKPQDKTPHENLMDDIKAGKALNKSPEPKIISVKDLFSENPNLMWKLNVLPGQRRRNVKARRLALKRQNPGDAASPSHSGYPSPPQMLRAELRKSTQQNAPQKSSVILRWQSSCILAKRGMESQDGHCTKIVGYRIYVNGQPKGMVAGTKTRALLDGLHYACEYRIHVRAVSALGESAPSNDVIALIRNPERTTQDSYEGLLQDDVVDRILRKYELQRKKKDIGGKFSPDLRLKYGGKSDVHPGLEDPTCSDDFETDRSETSHTSCQTQGTDVTMSDVGDDITPRSKALLEQLKGQLLL